MAVEVVGSKLSGDSPDIVRLESRISELEKLVGRPIERFDVSTGRVSDSLVWPTGEGLGDRIHELETHFQSMEDVTCILLDIQTLWPNVLPALAAFTQMLVDGQEPAERREKS